MTADWIESVTRWNIRGVRWREMSAGELIWIHHIETFEFYAQERKSMVRQYLVDTGDILRLRMWDNGSFREAE